jgi:hypothetical protein
MVNLFPVKENNSDQMGNRFMDKQVDLVNSKEINLVPAKDKEACLDKWEDNVPVKDKVVFTCFIDLKCIHINHINGYFTDHITEQLQTAFVFYKSVDVYKYVQDIFS